MIHKYPYYLLFLLLTVSKCSLAANIQLTGSDAANYVKGAEQVFINGETAIPSFILFKESEQPNFDNPDLWLRLNFGMQADFKLQLISTENDQLGYTHYRYVQTYQGKRLDGTMWLIHSKNNRVVSMNGFLADRLKGSFSPGISEQDALQKALDFVNASVYKWQIPAEEELLKRTTGNPSASYFPKGELIYSYDSRKRDGFSFKLAYRFDIYSDKPMSRKYISIDASNGQIADVQDRIWEANSNGTAVTGYAGIKSIVTDSVNTTLYRLRESGRGNGQGMETYNLLNGTTYGNAVDFTDDDNYWNNVNANKDQYATDAHFAAEMTYDYYFNRYGRNSIDNAGLKLVSYVHYSSNYVNAFWDGSRMTYGDGNGSYTPLTSLDIGGHEITHGLTEYTANLVYSYESGALNESFSDCFGTAVEWFADPSRADWLIGEDIGSPFRSHSNPNAYGDPDTYLGTNWYTGAGDNGGVHTNSGVQNHWFYLLSAGGSGTNDIGNAYNVSGIGIDKAAAITFRCLTVYLTSTSQYIDARNYSIQSAIDLYGACSPEMFATIDAWYAVGVGGTANTPTTISNSGSLTFCNGGSVLLVSHAPYGSTYQWYINGVIINGATSADYNATQNGTYYVVTNSCGNVYTSNSLTVNVITLTPSINPSGSAFSCDQVLLTANNTSGYNVQWNKDGIPISGATSANYTATFSGNYSFTLQASVTPAQTFSSNTVVSIPDNACSPPAISTIPVSGLPASISTSGISIRFNITHTFDGDIEILLVAPNGDVLGISDNFGSSGQNFINTVIADAGLGSITTGSAPFTGTFKPWASTFASCINTTKTSFASIGNGSINPNGNWSLHVYDRYSQDIGTIDNWSITFPAITQPSPDCGPVTSAVTAVSIGNEASISVTPASTLSYEINQINNFPASARSGGVAVTINGKGYYGFGGSPVQSDWWEYNPVNDTWTQKSSCPVGQTGGTSFSIGTKAYVIGGFNGTYLNSVYEWNSLFNTWQLKNNFGGGAKSEMASCIINGKGYVFGGTGNSGSSNEIWEYDPSADSWTLKNNFPTASGRKNLTVFVIAQKAYVGLGQTCGIPCTYSNEWYEYDAANNALNQKNNFPGSLRESANGFTISSKGYIIFGNSGSVNYSDYWEYDALQNSWSQKGSFSGLGRTSAASTVINNKAYIFGGNTSAGNTQSVLEFRVVNVICTNSPGSVVLQSSSGTSYLWNTNATTQSITGIPNGDYSVTVTNQSCSAVAYSSISINPIPTATISAGGPLIFCQGGSVTLTANASLSYLWSTGATSQAISVNSSGSYSVITSGQAGCTNTSANSSVVVRPQVPVTVVPATSATFCSGGNVQLNSYNYNSIPFAPLPGTGALVNLTDDQLSSALPIGFSFIFFGNTYTNFYISSNGFISFSAGGSGCCSGQLIPNTTAPNNLIAFAWTDLYPPAGGSIDYFTTGTAPNRKLVMNYTNIRHYPTGNNITAQVILFETTNQVEIHTTAMPTDGTLHTMGLENAGGTQAVIIPGRNRASFSLTNDAVRFSTAVNSYLWSTNATSSSITTGTNGSYSVTATDIYGCTGLSNVQNVIVNPLPTPLINPSGPTAICQGDSLTLSTGTYNSYLWSNSAATQNIVVYNAGNYSVTVTDANGCTGTSSPSSVSVSVCNVSVPLKAFIQGYYKGGGNMEAVASPVANPTICDTITLELREPVRPFNLAYSVKGVLNTQGNGTFVFPAAAYLNSYYLVIKHRNALETWSSNPVTMNSAVVNYDFTNLSSKAQGSNQVDLNDGNFALFSGDINQDGSINMTDFLLNESDTQIKLTGYVSTDLTGDWIVEAADYSLIENNIRLLISKIVP